MLLTEKLVFFFFNKTNPESTQCYSCDAGRALSRVLNKSLLQIAFRLVQTQLCMHVNIADVCAQVCTKGKETINGKKHHNEKYVPVNLLAAASDVGIHSSEEQWNMAEELFLMGRKN